MHKLFIKLKTADMEPPENESLYLATTASTEILR